MSLLRKIIYATCLGTFSAFAANYQAGVGNPSAPESQGCSVKTTDLTAQCNKILNGTSGTAMISGYHDSTDNAFYVLGVLQNTQPNGSATTVTTSVSATLTAADIQPRSNNGGIFITHLYRHDDVPIVVSVNGAQVATLKGGECLRLPAGGYGAWMTIQLAGSQTPTDGAPDNVNFFNLRIVAY